MNITLTPETGQRLNEKAALSGLDPNDLANALLADALISDPDDLTPTEVDEVRVGIRKGLEAFASGKARPVTAWAKEMQAKYNLPTETP